MEVSIMGFSDLLASISQIITSIIIALSRDGLVGKIELRDGLELVALGLVR